MKIGDPSDVATHIGPVIDIEAKDALDAHLADLKAKGRLLAEVEEGVLSCVSAGNGDAPIARPAAAACPRK